MFVTLNPLARKQHLTLVSEIIATLKHGKAADIHGLTAECLLFVTPLYLLSKLFRPTVN